MSYNEIVNQIEQAIQRKRQHEVISKLTATWAHQDGEEIARLQSLLSEIEPDELTPHYDDDVFDRSYDEIEDVPVHMNF